MRILLSLFLAAAAYAGELKVMSFNVRYPNPGDGANVWTARRELFVETVKKQNPDLMGTQELFHEQGEYIAAQMPGYAWFGVSRRGNHEDEHMGVFYKKDRLKLIESGDFWLSPTPEKAGSSAWGMTLPRMVTWGLFETVAGGTKFLYMNTHFPHRAEDEAARVMCAKVIASRMSWQDEKLPVVLTGDFNAGTGSGAYTLLTGLMKDTYLAGPKQEGPEGTFHGFRGRAGRERIDWILFRAPWTVKSAEILRDHKDALYPSDHFPVVATFEIP